MRLRKFLQKQANHNFAYLILNRGVNLKLFVYRDTE